MYLSSTDDLTSVLMNHFCQNDQHTSHASLWSSPLMIRFQDIYINLSFNVHATTPTAINVRKSQCRGIEGSEMHMICMQQIQVVLAYKTHTFSTLHGISKATVRQSLLRDLLRTFTYPIPTSDAFKSSSPSSSRPTHSTPSCEASF